VPEAVSGLRHRRADLLCRCAGRACKFGWTGCPWSAGPREARAGTSGMAAPEDVRG